MVRYEIEAEIWRSGGPGGWCFVTLPLEVAHHIRSLAGGMMAPFGSLRVAGTVDDVTWRTSLFADTKSGSFLLPIKAAIRARARVGAGDQIKVRIELES